jgi:hypothetical protein
VAQHCGLAFARVAWNPKSFRRVPIRLGTCPF